MRQTSAKAACNADDDEIASAAAEERDGAAEAEEVPVVTIEWRATMAVTAALVLVLRVCAGGGGK